MIILETGDIFDNVEADTLVNPVNCVGVMGKGLALLFKQRFPAMFADYTVRCSQRQVQLGQPYVWRGDLGPAVLNFPTKHHWRDKTPRWAIEHGLQWLADHYVKEDIRRVAMPMVGCGEGGLTIDEVAYRMGYFLNRLDLMVYVHAPPKATDDELRRIRYQIREAPFSL